MRRISLIISILIIAITFQINAQNAKQEVFIIGTMHQVPKILKNSYKPLYKKALKYQPDAIYVERSRPEDTLSMQNYFPRFLKDSDSLKQVFDYDEEKFQGLANRDLKDLEKEDFRYLTKSYIIKRDYANYRYYAYLLRYGLKGAKKPTRNENGDITHKLALKLGMKFIYSMDDQKDNRAYYKAWQACSKLGKENGDTKRATKKGIKITMRSIFPILFKRYGKWTNKVKTMKSFHEINSFRYTKNDCEPCKEGMYYWDKRNKSMAINIGEQIETEGHQKSLVVVGAGHVIGLREELNKLYPHLEVKIINEKAYEKSNDILSERMASEK